MRHTSMDIGGTIRSARGGSSRYKIDREKWSKREGRKRERGGGRGRKRERRKAGETETNRETEKKQGQRQRKTSSLSLLFLTFFSLFADFLSVLLLWV